MIFSVLSRIELTRFLPRTADCSFDFLKIGMLFPEFNSALENKKSEKLDIYPDRIKFSAVYIKGANGRIQSGAYSDQLRQVIALNIGLIRQDDNLTVCNGFDKCSHVKEIIFVHRIVRLDVSNFEKISPYY